jgi:hypothetical protein
VASGASDESLAEESAVEDGAVSSLEEGASELEEEASSDEEGSWAGELGAGAASELLVTSG